MWAPGSGGGYPRCPPAAADTGSVQGSESSEGCHEASFLLLFCFLRLKLALYSWGFHLQPRGLGPSPGDFPSVSLGWGQEVGCYQTFLGDFDCSWGQGLLL